MAAYNPGVHLLPTSPESRQALQLSGFYLFAFAGLGALLPFFPLILDARGLTGAEIGRILTLLPLFTVLAPPVWGTLADTLQARGPLLRLAIFGTGLSVLLLIPSWGVFGSTIAFAVVVSFRAPLIPLGDTVTRAVLGPRGHAYGRIRVWGSIGFALSVLTVGLTESARKPHLLFAAIAVAHAAALASVWRLKPPAGTAQPVPWRRALAQVGVGPFPMLLVASAVYFASHAAFDGFFSLHLRALGHSERLFGICWAVGVGAEIVFMPLSGGLLQRFRAAHLLVFSALVAAVRWLLLMVLTDPIAISLTQPLHAVTFGVWFVALIQAIQHHAGEALRGTFQAVATAALGVGRGAAFWVAGSILDSSGGAMLFGVSAMTAAVSVGLYGVYGALERRQSEMCRTETTSPVAS